MKKAIIFDMDGVLFDSEIVYARNRRDYFKTKGKFITEAQARQLAGWNSREYMALVFPNKDPETIQSYIKEYRAFVKERNKGIYPKIIFDGAKETLYNLKDKGYILALASSSQKEKINTALNACHIRKYFTYVLSCDDFKHTKPDPEIYETMVQRLQMPKDEIIVVEDSTYGIQAAKNAGLDIICKKDDRFSYDQSGCQYYIDDIRDLNKLMQDLQQ